MTLTAEQRGIRSLGVGSSEIAAIVGVSPFQTIHDVWMRKRGLAVFSGNRLTRMGSLMEEAIAVEYCNTMQDTGEACELKNLQKTFVHPDEPWIVASPDRVVVGRHKLVEAKNVGFRSMFAWGNNHDEIPDSYRCQVEWQMGVYDAVVRHETGEDPGPITADVVAWLGGCDLRIYPVKRDLRLWNALVSQARTFWFDHVLANVAPEIDGSEGAKRMVNTLFRESWKPFERATEVETELVLALREAKKTTTRAEEREEELRSRIKSQLGHREGLIGDGWKVTWKTQKDGKRPFKVQDIAVKENSR